MTYFDRKEKPINKIGKIDVVSGDDIKMADKVVYESICNTIS